MVSWSRQDSALGLGEEQAITVGAVKAGRSARERLWLGQRWQAPPVSVSWEEEVRAPCRPELGSPAQQLDLLSLPPL